MASTIVVGGQFGSEGKGKVAWLIGQTRPTALLVRCGGPNSGHTTCINRKEVVVRQLPSGAGNPNALLMLSAGCVVDPAVLLYELDLYNIERDRIIVDPNAALVVGGDREDEASVVSTIGSTGSGTGAAMARRLRRNDSGAVVGASDALRARVRVERVAPLVHEHLDRGGDVIVEGTQGFGLSLLHCAQYPYATSRDTTAAAFASEVGLALADVTEVVLVLRTFPIRVAGPSGDLPDEISWEEVQRISGAPSARPEFTSVTRKLRRVARFNLDAVRAAVRYNRPCSIALMGLDRIDYSNYRAMEIGQISTVGVAFIDRIVRELGVPVRWVGTGFDTAEAFMVAGAH